MELTEAKKQELRKYYRNALIALRPQGVIWKVKKGSVSDKELSIIAEFMTNLHLRTEKVFDEADLRTTLELLDEWENLYGLPHDGSYEERLAALNAAAAKGRQDIPFYIELAKINGCTAEIEEHEPFMVGLSHCGGTHELGSEDIVFYWTIVIKAAVADENINKLRLLINKLNQSHTIFNIRDERGKK